MLLKGNLWKNFAYPHSIINGKNEPKAIQVAERSLSTAHEMTNPLKWTKKGVRLNFKTFNCLKSYQNTCHISQSQERVGRPTADRL